MDVGLLVRIWIKGAAIGPTHVERAVIAIKIAPYVGFLGAVACVQPVFPVCGECLEFESGVSWLVSRVMWANCMRRI
jgi:hypothetical protein